jgi:hypothetical protein
MSTSKPIKRPVPKPAAAVAPVAEAVVEAVGKVETTTSPAPASSSDGIADLNVKMDKLLELAQAIDWKIWIYLKANNYIE